MPVTIKLKKEYTDKSAFEQEVPEAQRALYEEKDGKFLLGAVEFEDVTGLKSALQKERDSVKQLKKELQETADKYKELDPEKAREALAKLAELEDKKLLDAGEIDKVVEKRTERLRADHEGQVKRFQDQQKTLEQQNHQLKAQLANLQIDHAISRVVTTKRDLGINPVAIPDIQRRAREVFNLDEKGQIIPRRADGSIIYGKDPTQPMSMEEWLPSLRPEAPHYFMESGGAGGGNDAGGGVPKKKRSEMSPSEKAAFIGKHGQEAYLSLPA